MIHTSGSSAPSYRANIIGLGAIAQGYRSSEGAWPYCHAVGLLQCDRFDLVAVCARRPHHFAAMKQVLKVRPRLLVAVGPSMKVERKLIVSSAPKFPLRHILKLAHKVAPVKRSDPHENV
jgi:hypothetical protein